MTQPTAIRVRRVALVALTATLLAACGDGGGGNDGDL